MQRDFVRCFFCNKKRKIIKNDRHIKAHLLAIISFLSSCSQYHFDVMAFFFLLRFFLILNLRQNMIKAVFSVSDV
jgi:hypothetical protein